MRKILKLTRLPLLALAILALGFAGCSDVSTASDSVAPDSILYGSLTVGGGSARAIDVSEISTATVTVSGSGMNDITQENVAIAEGQGSVTFEKIPVGNNRVVTVQSNVDGAVIRALVDIKSGSGNSVTVSWDTTAAASVFYNLIKSNVKGIESLSPSHFDSYIPSVPANLVDAAAIASDYRNNKLSQDAKTYTLGFGTVNVTATGMSGYTVQITDIASKKAKIDSDSYTSPALEAYPGTWKVRVYDADGEIVDTKDILVASGYESTVNLSYSAGEKVTGKIIVHVPSSLGYSYVYAWDESSGTKYTGDWTGTSMGNAVDGYYSYTLNQAKSNIIFNNGSGGSAGNGQTADLYIKEGEWNYTGDAKGTEDKTGGSIAKNFTEVEPKPSLSFTVVNPTVPQKPTVSINYADGDEISLTDSITFVVTSPNTELTSGTYTIGSYNGTLSVGTTKVALSKAGITKAGQSVKVSASVKNAVGEDSLSVQLTTVENAEPSTPTRLGATYEKCGTSFAIWSPDSSNVKVAVKKQGESSFTEYTCTKGFTVNGDYSDTSNIYGITLKGDYNLAEYQFYIGGKAVRDPYGKMVKYEDADAKTNIIKANYTESNCTVTSYAGSSINIVVDTDSILPTDGSWYNRPSLSTRAESVVYEIHVGDFTASDTWGGTSAYKGKFKGLVESGTTYSSGGKTVKTGLDHLVELGVTHVQIMPMYDFATKYNHTLGEYYNWGYDPVNYNVPEDRYALDPTNYEERIREVKDMVNILHKNGIRVIMDVVYNHTFDGEMFNKISTKYYTETDLSGCGNSVDVSNAMVSRMVRDSLEYWLTTFNLDGFRFDLMGIYTNSAIGGWGQYLNNNYSDRTLLLYGEPYQANNNESTSYAYASSIPGLDYAGIGGFAHKYRETVKGGSDDGTKGYMFNNGDNASNVMVGLKGSGTSLGSDSDGVWTRYFTKNPYQAVNYLSAHDNLCLYDKIVAAGITTSNSAYQQALVKFGHGIVVLSQGVGFLHGGDDFLRTKSGGKWSEFKIDTRTAKENSYMFGQEMNLIDWSRKVTFNDVFNYNKDLIAFKRKHNGFYNGSASTSADGMTIYYTVKDSDGTTLTCVLNPGSDLSYSGGGTQVFNKTGAVSSSDTKCEGTGVTIFKK